MLLLSLLVTHCVHIEVLYMFGLNSPIYIIDKNIVNIHFLLSCAYISFRIVVWLLFIVLR